MQAGVNRKGATMKLSKFLMLLLAIVLLIGCSKKKEKSAGELYQEALVFLTDIEKSDPEKALEYLNKAISLEPDFTEAYISRAEAHISFDNSEMAFEDFEKAIQLDPTYAEVYFKRGKVYSGLEQNEKAFEDFNKAISLKPNFAEVYFERGKVLFSLSAYKKAFQDFSHTLSIDPNHTKASFYLNEVRPFLNEESSYNQGSSDSVVSVKPKKVQVNKARESKTYAKVELNYIDNNDGTVTDKSTGYIWQKENDDTTRTWQGAGQYCKNITLAGYTDWTLPDSTTLLVLNRYGNKVHAISKAFKTKRWGYWTKSTELKSPGKAKAVKYDYQSGYNGYVGKVVVNNKNALRYARCVRMK